MAISSMHKRPLGLLAVEFPVPIFAMRKRTLPGIFILNTASLEPFSGISFTSAPVWIQVTPPSVEYPV